MDYITNAHKDTISKRSIKRSVDGIQRIWFMTIGCLTLSVVFLLIAYVIILNKNISVEVGFKRIDGIVINEKMDVRRKVLIDNIEERRRIKGEVE